MELADAPVTDAQRIEVVVWAVVDKDWRTWGPLKHDYTDVSTGTLQELADAYAAQYPEHAPFRPVRCVGGPDPAHERIAAVVRAARELRCRTRDCGDHIEQSFLIHAECDLREALDALTPEDLARCGADAVRPETPPEAGTTATSARGSVPCPTCGSYEVGPDTVCPACMWGRP